MNQSRRYPDVILKNEILRMGDRRVTHASTEEYIEAWNGVHRYHRKGGPATIKNGTEFWYEHGNLHREDGPAVVKPNGKHEFWYYGRYYRLEEWCEVSGRLSEAEKAYYLLKYSK